MFGIQNAGCKVVTIWFLLIVTIIVVSASVGGLLFIRKRVSYTVFQKHHEVADPLLSVVGTLFAVLLGFMVANAMQRFQDAVNTAQQEGNSIMDVYRLAEGLPQPTRGKLEAAISNYVDSVIHEEWPKLEQKQTSDRAWATYGEIWSTSVHFQPTNNSESNLHAKMLDALTTFGDCRRQRVEALHNGLPPVLWCVLLMGGVATISFTYFFGIENVRVQVLMTALVSIAICLNLFLLASFDDPFSGDVKVQPTAFVVDQESIKRMAATAAEKAH